MVREGCAWRSKLLFAVVVPYSAPEIRPVTQKMFSNRIADLKTDRYEDYAQLGRYVHFRRNIFLLTFSELQDVSPELIAFLRAVSLLGF